MKHLVSRDRLSLNKTTISMLNVTSNEHNRQTGKMEVVRGINGEQAYPTATDTCATCDTIIPVNCGTETCIYID